MIAPFSNKRYKFDPKSNTFQQPVVNWKPNVFYQLFPIYQKNTRTLDVSLSTQNLFRGLPLKIFRNELGGNGISNNGGSKTAIHSTASIRNHMEQPGGYIFSKKDPSIFTPEILTQHTVIDSQKVISNISTNAFDNKLVNTISVQQHPTWNYECLCKDVSENKTFCLTQTKSGNKNTYTEQVKSSICLSTAGNALTRVRNRGSFNCDGGSGNVKYRPQYSSTNSVNSLVGKLNNYDNHSNYRFKKRFCEECKKVKVVPPTIPLAVSRPSKPILTFETYLTSIVVTIVNIENVTYTFSTNNGANYSTQPFNIIYEPITISPLSSSTDYKVKVKATNSTRESTESDTYDITTLSAATGPLLAPVISIYDIGFDSVTIKVKPVVVGAKYSYSYSSNYGADYSNYFEPSFELEESLFNIGGLSNAGGFYKIKVKVIINENTVSEDSKISESLDVQLSGEVEDKTIEKPIISFIKSGVFNAILRIDNPQTGISYSYILNNTEPYKNIIKQKGDIFVVRPLTPNTNYSIQVKASSSKTRNKISNSETIKMGTGPKNDAISLKGTITFNRETTSIEFTLNTKGAQAGVRYKYRVEYVTDGNLYRIIEDIVVDKNINEIPYTVKLERLKGNPDNLDKDFYNNQLYIISTNIYGSNEIGYYFTDPNYVG